jgi:hypothetical protein
MKYFDEIHGISLSHQVTKYSEQKRGPLITGLKSTRSRFRIYIAYNHILSYHYDLVRRRYSNSFFRQNFLTLNSIVHDREGLDSVITSLAFVLTTVKILPTLTAHSGEYHSRRLRILTLNFSHRFQS